MCPPERWPPEKTPLIGLLADCGEPCQERFPWPDDELVRVRDTCERQPDGTTRFESRVAETGELLHAATFAADGRLLSIEEPSDATP